MNGLTADPGLNTEPTARNEGAKNSGDVRSAHAERSANEDREGNAVARAGMGIEQHGNQNDQIAEEDGDDGLKPVHAFGDEAGREHVGGYANTHGNPEGGVVVDAPGTLFVGDRSEVRIIERGMGVLERDDVLGEME